jgi:mono/diheme cytochrome c family protein
VRGPALALLLAGCGGATGDGYDPAARFAPRADPVVVRTPPSEPAGLHRPGELDKALFALADRGGVVFDPAKLPPDEQAKLTQVLENLFGTPAAPRVAVGPEDRPLADGLGLTADQLAAGGAAYKAQCVQCHGTAGDGRGPTGAWVYPHPRDFRSGAYKFASTPTGRPTREDLVRILRRGVTGNAMPGYPLLPDDRIDALAAYTVYLGLRGRVEYDALAAMLGDGLEDELPAFARDRLRVELRAWAGAEATAVRPGSPPDLDDEARIREGHALFVGAAGCASCHADYGRREQYRYDVWGVAVRPADLTAGDYHGGKEPGDLFLRVRCGIPGAGMPAAPAGLTDDQVWAVVAFVRALPVPRLLPPDVRAGVYPGAK